MIMVLLFIFMLQKRANKVIYDWLFIFLFLTRRGDAPPLSLCVCVCVLMCVLMCVCVCNGSGVKCICFVLRFYGPVSPMASCRARSVYPTTRLLGRLNPLSG